MAGIVRRQRLLLRDIKSSPAQMPGVERIRQSGLTVLIVEQNVQQVLKVVDRAYLLEAGSIRMSGTSAELAASDTIREAYLGV